MLPSLLMNDASLEGAVSLPVHSIQIGRHLLPYIVSAELAWKMDESRLIYGAAAASILDFVGQHGTECD